MQFEKYDEDEHFDLVPEFFSDVAREPQRFNDFREATEEAFNEIDDVVGMDADFDVVLADVDMDQFGEEVPLGLYFRGYSLGKEAHDHAERDIVFLAAPSRSEYWRPGLKNMAVHEEAHQEFYNHFNDMDHSIWESMVFEGHALSRENTVRNVKEYEWNGDPRNYDDSAQEVIQILDKHRQWQGSKYSRENASSLFSMESSWEGIGYVIAEQVYTEILDKNSMDVDEPLHREKDWLRKQVEEAIQKLYP